MICDRLNTPKVPKEFPPSRCTERAGAAEGVPVPWATRGGCTDGVATGVVMVGQVQKIPALQSIFKPHDVQALTLTSVYNFRSIYKYVT